MVSQLGWCDKLKRLDLGGSSSMDIGRAVAASKSLTEFYLYDCEIPRKVYKDTVQQLQKHTGLEKLHLNRTKGIPTELGDVVFRMGSLKQFFAKGCCMSGVSAGSVLTGLANCHDLKDLRLVGNFLTDYLGKLFPSGDTSGPGFQHLNRLWLNKTSLSQDDLQALSHSLRCNKLPQLMYLDLSLSKLTGSLRSLFFGTGHPGFPFLRVLALVETELSRDVLMSLKEAVNQNRMPQLRYLRVGKNDLSTAETEVRNLVKACTATYDKLEIMIQFYQNKLLEVFIHEMKAICEGTVVCIVTPY